MSRTIERVVPGTISGPITRLIGTVDVDGRGTEHPLAEVDPFILLDAGVATKNGMPPFGAHPHRGHSVVTILLAGRMESWDSFGDRPSILSAPASYWVDAGTGVFHEERSVIDDETDPAQHVRLFQLWVGVTEADRRHPPRVQHDAHPIRFDLKDGDGVVVGSGIYFVGPMTRIETPHPVTVAHIRQHKGTTYRHPIPPDHGGFVVQETGRPSFAGTSPHGDRHDVLVLANDQAGRPDYLEIRTEPDRDAEYLICSGERHREKWYKKLVANGAVITASEEQGRVLAVLVEVISKAGKAPGGSFAPFGAAAKE